MPTIVLRRLPTSECRPGWRAPMAIDTAACRRWLMKTPARTERTSPDETIKLTIDAWIVRTANGLSLAMGDCGQAPAPGASLIRLMPPRADRCPAAKDAITNAPLIRRRGQSPSLVCDPAHPRELLDSSHRYRNRLGEQVPELTACGLTSETRSPFIWSERRPALEFE